MYLNMFLLSFGLDPDDFVNEALEPIVSDNGTTIYNLRQEVRVRICPKCGSIERIHINNHYWTENRFTFKKGQPTVIRINRVQFLCQSCHSTFTIPIKGIDRYAHLSQKIESLIVDEFYVMKSFKIIADDYQLSTTEVMRIFDRNFPYIKRETLPYALCIDEIGYKSDDGSYASILYDHERKVIVDVIRNRQTAYLREYFSFISLKERSKVKYFISDLYQEYETIRSEFFPQSIHIADLFHVTRILKTEVGRQRIRTMKQYTNDDSPERNFMKRHWAVFECFLSKSLANKTYYSKKEHFLFTSWDMMQRCLKLNVAFWDAYACLQELLNYPKYPTHEEAKRYVERVINKLKASCNEDLDRIARTYTQRKNEIAQTLCIKTSQGGRYSNGLAEGLNNQLKTIIKSAYRYHNFNRFRKRAMLIMTYKNKS